jgi:tRNA threonylcarbamoyladenosine biosynthesis protein TsaE
MDLGLDDYLYGRGVCVVEWAEKALSLMPQERLLIRLDYLSDTERRFRLEASGRRYSKIVSQVKKSPFR